MTVQLRGEVANMRGAIQNFALALPLAVLLIYLVMVALFRSLIDPLDHPGGRAARMDRHASDPAS